MCRGPGLRDAIAVKRLFGKCVIYGTIFPRKHLCAASQGNVTKLPWSVCVPCARFTWQYYPYNMSVPCGKFTWHNCLKTSLCHVPVLRDNISPNSSRYLVPGFRDTIALKRLCPVCQCCVRIFPRKRSLYCEQGLRDTIALKRLCAVCQVYMKQLPLNDCAPCARFTWQYFH